MRSWISIAFSTTLFLTLPVNSAAQSEGPLATDFDPTDGDQKQRVAGGAEPGSVYELQLHVTDAPAINGWSATIEYDPEQVRYVTGSFQAGVFISGLLALVDEKESSIGVGGTVLGTTARNEGNGLLGTLSFEVLEGFTDSTELVITRVTFRRIDGEEDKRTVRSVATLLGKSLTPSTPLLAGDFDNNGRVDFDDFFLFADNFGGTDPLYDLDDGGGVDFDDFFIFADNFGSRGEITVELPGGVTMTMVWIKLGTFMMGFISPDHSNPGHEVTISKGFYLGKYEITQQQWGAVMGTAPWVGESYVQNHPYHPAVNISWNDVQEFIQTLNDAAGEDIYRLPTEAEWEYACRAGTMTQWSFGDDSLEQGEYAWYKSNTCDVGECYAHTVGTKLPNPWGLYDMHGNVHEWVQDWYKVYTSDSQIDPIGPTTSPEGARVYRGGVFVNDGVQPSRLRGAGAPTYSSYGIGARLLRIR